MMPMIATTINSSMSVKPLFERIRMMFLLLKRESGFRVCSFRLRRRFEAASACAL
jgi:hypothetical protein